jgi:quercetin dioxygenase-like cupin family protein
VTLWKSVARSVVLAGDEGDPLRVFGNQFLLKVDGAASQGAMAFLTGTFAPGTGAIPHLHRGHDEIFYVLDGRFRFHLGEEQTESGPGGLLFAPRNAAHGFTNIGDSTGSLIGVVAPAGYEQHFVEISGVPDGPDARAALAEIFQKYDQEPA